MIRFDAKKYLKPKHFKTFCNLWDSIRIYLPRSLHKINIAKI